MHRLGPYVKEGREEAAHGRRRYLGVVHGGDDDGEPGADAGDAARGHELGEAAAQRHGERAGHEEDVGQHERAAAAEQVGGPAGGEDGHEHEDVDGAREHLDLRVGEPQVLPDEQLRAAHQREVCQENEERHEV